MLTELPIGKSQLSAVYNLRIKTRQCQNLVTCKAKKKKKKKIYIYIREGNGTPLQYTCLENPMDGGAW